MPQHKTASATERTTNLLKIERHLVETVAQVGGGKDPCKIRGEEDDYGNYYFYIDIGREKIGIKRQVQLAAVLTNAVRPTPFSQPIKDLGFIVSKIHLMALKGRLCYLFMVSPDVSSSTT